MIIEVPASHFPPIFFFAVVLFFRFTQTLSERFGDEFGIDFDGFFQGGGRGNVRVDFLKMIRSKSRHAAKVAFVGKYE